MIRYVSLFSGIEAATVAWAPLGWRCAGVAEIEPFPCAVLKHHYPDVPNLGDITKITRADIAALGRIDLIVGGFPCQDVSVAGQRKGLKNADGTATRSGLFFDAMRLVRHARKHCGLRWIVIENVPGLYSSNKGRDFAEVVGEIAGTGFDVPRDGWKSAGCALGPDGLVEWDCLDARFFGLAQRRERVFLVGDFGDWPGRAPVLLERAGLLGNHSPRREKGQRPAPTIAARTKGGGGLGTDFDLDGGLIASDVAPPVTSNPYGDHESRDGLLVAFGGNNTSGAIDSAICVDIAPTMTARTGTGTGMNGMDDYCVVGALQGGGSPRGHGTAGVNSQSVAAGHVVPVAYSGVRRLTPRECERLMGFPDDFTRIPIRRYAKRKVTRSRPADYWERDGDGWILMAADGPRYKALGNSFAVPVVRWIGERIAAADAGNNPEPKKDTAP